MWDTEVTRRRQLGPLAVQQLTVRKAPTLGEWITDRWAPEHAASLADATRERYANVYSVHVALWLEDVPVNEITVGALRAWQAQRVKAGVSPGMIDKARTLLSSVLRHAAESEVIPANPLSVVRAPKNGHRDAVQPLSPATVERIRAAMLNPPPCEIAAAAVGQRARRAYELPAPGTPQTRQRDALISRRLPMPASVRACSGRFASATSAKGPSSCSGPRTRTGRSSRLRRRATGPSGCCRRSRRTCVSTGSQSGVRLGSASDTRGR